MERATGLEPASRYPANGVRHSQEPSRTSHSTGLRPWVEATGPRLPVAASLRWIFAPIKNGAGDGARTRYLHLGKVALYQMSYARMMRGSLDRAWCLRSESNQRHEDFQSSALPTELQRHIGDREGARTLDLQRDRLAF